MIEYVGEAPERGSLGAAGYDLRASEDFFIEGQHHAKVKTDFKMQLPQGVAGLVLSRSGLADKNGIHVLNAPGLIDPDYTGIVSVILHNTTLTDYRGKAGDKIAQLLFVPHYIVSFKQVKSLQPTERGEGAFGSTGR